VRSAIEAVAVSFDYRPMRRAAEVAFRLRAARAVAAFTGRGSATRAAPGLG
jgi:hypothetical protein